MARKFEIRNSTAEFLTFVAEGREQGVQVFYKDETVWATQKAMATLFDCSSDNIGLHLKNIFKTGELDVNSVTEKISATAADGKNYLTKFYNLDAIISVGYRVNSIRATAIDYNKDAPTTRSFYRKVQNKMHYAVHGHTAAELIVERKPTPRASSRNTASSKTASSPPISTGWATKPCRWISGNEI